MKLGSFFETKTRDNGEEYVTLREAVREAHSGDMPNDWIYVECRATCDAIDAGDLRDEDSMHEYADGRVDVYTKALYQWAADFCLKDTWAEAECEANEIGALDMRATEERLKMIQFCAIRRIARTMLDYTRENLAEAS